MNDTEFALMLMGIAISVNVILTITIAIILGKRIQRLNKRVDHIHVERATHYPTPSGWGPEPENWDE